MKIKNIEVGDLFLAPMAGVTDVGFRSIARKYGATLTYTEMISATALKYNRETTKNLLETADNEHPMAVQIFGNNPEIMAEACCNPLLQKFDIIDINMGCPAPKIVKNGEGVSLMNNLELAEKIIIACVKSTDKPITVKFRKGFLNNEEQCFALAQICEKCGVSAITIHGRTHSQMYSGNVDYETIKKIKEKVSIPVIGNGDVVDIESYKRMLATGVDAVMVGRGTLGKPWLFTQLNRTNVNVDIVKEIKNHLEILGKYQTEKYMCQYMRKHFLWYAKNFEDTAKIRNELATIDKLENALKIFSNLKLKQKTS